MPEVRVMTPTKGLNVYDRDYNDLIERLNKYKTRMVIVWDKMSLFICLKNIPNLFINSLHGSPYKYQLNRTGHSHQEL